MVLIYYDNRGNIGPILHTVSKTQILEDKDVLEMLETEYAENYTDMDLMNNYIYNATTNKIEKKLQLILKPKDTTQEQIDKQAKEIEELKNLVASLNNKI